MGFPLRSFFYFLLAVAVALPAVAQARSVSFSMVDLDGREFRSDEYRGKWIVVNYWATWCPPCVEEIPELVLFHEEHKETKAVVLGVNYEETDADSVRAFGEEYFVSYPVVHTKPGSITPFGRIKALPTTYLIDPDGRVAAKAEGGVTREALESYIDSYQPPQASSR